MWFRRQGEQESDASPGTDVEQAEGSSRLERAATSLVGRLISAGIDGIGPFDPARRVAEEALAEHGEREAAVDALVRSHTRLAAVGGFVTGVGGLVTLPVALPANIVEYYLLATRMAAGVAHLRGYDLTRAETRTAVLLVLVGADADQVLRKAGIPMAGLGTGGIAGLALQRLPRPALMVVNKGVGFQLLSSTGARGLSKLGRAVPLVGGVVGAAMDAWLIRAVARHSRREFTVRTASDSPGPA